MKVVAERHEAPEHVESNTRRQDRVAAGKGARADVPLAAHAEFSPGPERDPVGRLLEQAVTRVPELVPVAARAHAGLAVHVLPGCCPADGRRPGDDTDVRAEVQLCGDAHLANFGVFASPERRLVFDLNDFDETLPGPFEWDVKRLAASFAVAGRDRAFKPKETPRRSS